MYTYFIDLIFVICCCFLFVNSAPTVHVLSHVKCRGKEHMETELKRVESLGGEGLMIRKPGSSYEECRSHNLLKIKTFHDAEVSVMRLWI